MARAAGVTRDIVDTAGHLDVRSYPRGPMGPDNVVYYPHSFVLTHWRRRNSSFRNVSRYIETIEVSITTGTVAAMVGNVYRCHRVYFTVVLGITVRPSALFCINHCVCNSSELDTLSTGNSLSSTGPCVLNACPSDAQTVYKKNTRVNTTKSSLIYTSLLQRLCLYLVSRSADPAVASRAEQRGFLAGRICPPVDCQ